MTMNNHTIRTYLLTALLCMMGACLPVHASSDHADEGEPVNIKEIIFDHIGDAYEWHVATIGDKHISIPLPVIVYSYEGFHIATEGDYKGKVVETLSTGEVKRPMLDLSLTKIAAGIVFNSLLLVTIILCVSRWYRRKEASDDAPRGFVGMIEMLIMMVYDGIIKPSVGKDYERFAPYLLTAFFFIFLSNLMGLVPFFPGGANVTGNIAITLFLAVCTFLAINLFGTREYWREVLWPDVPLWMKCPVPLMPVIEIFGLITKPFALTIRLLANIMAGHSVILALVCIIFITHSMGALLGGSMTVVSVLFTIFMNFLELLVAFIQAYVFTMLSAVFIGLSRVEHHEK